MLCIELPNVLLIVLPIGLPIGLPIVVPIGPSPKRCVCLGPVQSQCSETAQVLLSRDTREEREQRTQTIQEQDVASGIFVTLVVGTFGPPEPQ